MEAFIPYNYATIKQNRCRCRDIEYKLKLRQQPKQSRMCGIGEKADRRPIDPPPIVQLNVCDKTGHSDKKYPHLFCINLKRVADSRSFYSYLQNPYYFMYASLMAADLDEEIHLLQDGKTRSTTGSVVASLYHLKDIDGTDAGFFVFPDISVRTEGSYRLKLSLFEVIGKEAFHCRSIISDTFLVYSAKKFPGMEESTFLSRSFADQGLKIRIRKELRQKRKNSCSEHAAKKREKVDPTYDYCSFQTFGRTPWHDGTTSPISDQSPFLSDSSYRKGSQDSIFSLNDVENNSQNSSDQYTELQKPSSYASLAYPIYPPKFDQNSNIYQNQ